MRNVTIVFPDDERVEPAYRGKSITIEYSIMIEEWGLSASFVYNGEEIPDRAREYVIERITGGRPIGKFAENAVHTRPKWPMHDWR